MYNSLSIKISGLKIKVARQKIVEKLNAAAPHFRYLLAKRVALRVVPEITFIQDKTQDKAMSLEALIENESERYKAPQEKPKRPVKKK